MLSYEEALTVLRSFTLKEQDDWDRHSIMVGDVAYKIALELKKYMDMDAERVRVMGLVHDFGRHVSNDPYRHAYEGYKYMTETGHPDLARICVCHSNGTYREEEIKEYNLKPEDFYCKSIEEKIVFMADNLDYRGTLTRNDVRIRNTIERYRDINPDMIPVLESKIEEFALFNEEITDICGRSVYEILGIE